MSHTPGPWHYHYATAVGEESEDGDYNAAFGITSRSKEEFQADGNRGDLVAYVPWDCDHIANARLIAAAPEMLAALRELVHYDEGSSEQGSYGYEVLSRCKAVIAKAEGRE
jgi:hypothetical protein